MTSRHRYRAALVALSLQVVVCVAARADDVLDVEYAEHEPLATQSLLLDVALHGSRLVAVGERGHVVLSDDDGRTWRQAETVPTRSTLTTVFSIGDRLFAGGHDAVIITSGDHGKNWSRQYFDPGRQQAVMDMYFRDEMHGMAVGSYGLYLLTSDGGRTWEDSAVDEENEYHLNGIVRFDEQRMMIAGEAGFSYRTFDGGDSWEMMDLPYQGSMWGGIRTNDECALFFGLRGHAMESCDFGDTWNELDTGTQLSLSGAAMSNGLLVIAGNSGVVLTRTDGRFTTHIHSSGVDFAGALALPDGHFVLVGEDGAHEFPEVTGGDSVD
ncbi:MAG: YCF48-related protein [Lysobacterales bacterium]